LIIPSIHGQIEEEKRNEIGKVKRNNYS